MKVEYVNCFVQGAQTTLTSLCGEPGALGKLFVKQSPYSPEEVSIIIGFTGDITGEVIYTMSNDCGVHLASKFMAGFEVDSMSELAQSAVAEIANMISGNAANSLFSVGVKVDITPPAFVSHTEKEKFGFIKDGDKVLCMPMSLNGGQVFEIDLHLEN